MVDTVNGLQVLNFDGRVLSQPRFQGMRADFLSPLTLGYASDAVALIDPADAKSVRLFDPITAKQTSTITHAIEVEAVALSQTKGLRRLALIDKNRDLYLTPTAGASELYKLHVMVDTIRWNDDNGSLCAVADGHLVVWHYPEVVYMDRELLPATTSKQDASAVGKTAELVEWISKFMTINPGDVICSGTPPGVGCFMKPPRFLKDGDVVDVEIDEIGTVTNTVVAEDKIEGARL